jgi:peptidoglycan/LPS O-acetylase OafA/YrhL
MSTDARPTLTGVDVTLQPVAPAAPRASEDAGSVPAEGVDVVRGHVPALDGVRGMAIALVMACHAVGSLRPTGTLDSIIVEIARSGWMGVDLFFVLSGFLITGILLDARGRPDYFRRFYLRRTLRIFPLYYAILGGLFIVLPLVAAGVREQAWFAEVHERRWWFWTYTSNVLLSSADDWSVTGILGHFWSLAVEEQFYLVWPAVVLACSARRLRAVCLAIMAGALTLRIAMSWGNPGLASFTLMPARADSLAAGAWIAVALRTGVPVAEIRRLAGWIGAASALAVVALFVRDRAFSEKVFIVQTIGFTCLALGFAALIAWSLDTPASETTVGRLFRNRVLRTFGKYSYAMYCLHPLVQDSLGGIGVTVRSFPLVAGSVLPGVVAYAALVLVVTVGVSLGTWHLIEKRFLRLKDALAPSVGALSRSGA